jgi:hypothetical protein
VERAPASDLTGLIDLRLPPSATRDAAKSIAGIAGVPASTSGMAMVDDVHPPSVASRPPSSRTIPSDPVDIRQPRGASAMSPASVPPVRFGALLRQADNQWTSIAESARISDDLGFHSIHFIDHLLAIPDPTGDILESWTTLTACAAITRRVRLGGNVLCNSFRARGPERSTSWRLSFGSSSVWSWAWWRSS